MSSSGRYLAGDVCSIMTCFSIGLCLVLYTCNEAGRQLFNILQDLDKTLTMPSDLRSAQILHQTLKQALTVAEPNTRYQLWISITLAFCSIYVFKQAFCVPGSLLLNLFAGAMFGFRRALPLVCCLTVCGTTLCYLISNFFGRRIANRLFGHRIERVRHAFQSHRSNLAIYLISLRIFPFTPNFLLNLASPILGVPFPHFLLSNLFGLLPYNIITTKAGGLLGSLNSVSAVFDWASIMQLIVLALLALLPSLLKSRFKSYSLDDTDDEQSDQQSRRTNLRGNVRPQKQRNE